VGWLQVGSPHEIGPVSEPFFAGLVRLLAEPWQPVVTKGFASCGFCQFSRGPYSLRYKRATIALGAANVFVPGESEVFLAPSLMAHYIDAHRYRPPDVFQEAVLRCPEMGSTEYLDMIRARGLNP